jgi:hypothetical protein
MQSLPPFVRRTFSLSLAIAADLSATASEIDFSRDIQPILSDNCYACHGPDEEDRAADLRLDTPEGVKTVLSADNILESEFIHRILTDDPDDAMPPPDKKDPLSVAEVELLRKWILDGAKWGVHWAFEAPTKPAPPAGKAHPVDAFVQAGLRESGLTPAPRASRETLLRRLSLDLIGLPPTPAELDAFLNDQSPDAFAKATTRLLDSPHFGERWARWWLDAARYADSNGYEKDSVRYVWPYRDWVIDAFNRNEPYDQFIIKQVGGDLIENASLQDRVATGFLRNSMVNEEGAIKYEQFRIEGIFDRVDTIGKSILGLTTGCAQCHSHKYDPIQHDEYFGIFAYLNNAHESTVPFYTDGGRKKIAEIEISIERIRNKALQSAGALESRTQWITKQRGILRGNPAWTIVTPELLGDGGQKFYPREDGSLISMGYAPSRSAERFAGTTTMDTIRSIRLELLKDPYLTFGGPGRSLEGSAALSEWKLFAGTDPEKLVEVKLQPARSDLDLPSRPVDSRKWPQKDGAKDDRTEGPAAFATDGNVKTAWATEAGPDRTNQPRILVANLAEPLKKTGEGPIHLRFELHCQHGGWNSNDNHHRSLGRFRFSFSGEPWPEVNPVSPKLAAILEKPESKWTAEEKSEIDIAWIESDPGRKQFAEAITKAREAHPVPVPQLAMQERSTPRETRLFHRGEQQHPKHKVEPHVPEFLHDLPEGDPKSRLTFARWLVDRESPTTARTLVNRTWQALFGTGIVESVEDLGRQSTRPSHPALLDWLAVEFMESGWDFKHLVQIIVSSETYQQDSAIRPGDWEQDPRNRLLARGARFRPDAEVVRDTQLAVSGLLNRRVGGDSVRPPIPGFLFLPPASYGYKTWEEDTEAANRYRRALYTFRFRTVPPPFLAAFDAPTGEVSCVRRPQSTTPLQALATLNEPLSIEAAQALARQIEGNSKAGTPESIRQSIGIAFRQCTSRAPDASELDLLTRLFETEKATGGGDAFLAVARVLLNLDETIVKS